MIQGQDVADLLEAANQLVDSIPMEIERIELVGKLKVVCDRLARLDDLTSWVFFRDKVQTRFEFSDQELSAYMRRIRDLRRQYEAASKVPEPEIFYSADFDGLIDLVECDGSPAFLIKTSEEVSVVSRIQIGGKILLPPEKTKIPFLLPRASEVMLHWNEYKNGEPEILDRQLYESLLEYFKQVAELRDEEAYDLLVAWVLHTYFLERMQFSPFICLYGLPERGKSRLGRSMVNVAFRGMSTESLNAPHLIRATRDLKATLFVDVRDFGKKAKAQQSTDLVLLRFERGVTVARIMKPGLGPHLDTEFYSIFGPTVLATNEPLDEIIETRSIVIGMPASSRKFNLEVTPEFALGLKERLVAFRARHLTRQLPLTEKVAGGRLGDLAKPLLQMVTLVKPEAREPLRRFILHIEAERRASKSESFEGEILRALLSSAADVRNGRVFVKRITDIINERKDDHRKVDARSVGRKLGLIGFEKSRAGPNGAAALIWNTPLIDKLAQEYGLSSETSESPEVPAQVRSISATEFLKRRKGCESGG